jgi:uncharacterized protein (TIGR02246 family)
MKVMPNEEIEKLYKNLLTYWNTQDAKGMASLFSDDGNAVGFDGSQMNGKNQIETEIKQVFENHKTARYVWKVKEIRFLGGGDIVLLRAIVGMVPPGKDDINPQTNAIQSLIAVKQQNNWLIALFQNTPAQFHGRPELVEEMTNELRERIKISN